MANQIYANGMEVSCKAAAGKSICAFPDVCMTPPMTPATPPGVPIPYPNTGMASDTTSGSSSVKISGQEVMLKDKSYFKRSMGDEAGSAPKKGVATSVNMGKVYFAMWSMNVKFEGENVVRMLDITTHNHASCPSNTPPMTYIDEATAGLGNFSKCSKEQKAVKKACNGNTEDPCPGALSKPKPKRSSQKQAGKLAKEAEKSDCAQAVKCFLRPYKTGGENSCCDGQTGHHIPPFSTTESVSGMSVKHDDALCICLEGTSHSIGSHGKHHHGLNYLLKKLSSGTKALFKRIVRRTKGKHKIYKGKLSDHVKVAARVTEEQNGCSKECIEQQLKSQFTKEELGKEATHNASTTGGESYGRLETPDKSALDKAVTSTGKLTTG